MFPEYIRFRETKKNLFYLSDNPLISIHGNAMQNFMFYQSLFDLDKERFEKMLSRLQLPLNRRVSTFSKGMRRQLFLCIALSFKGQYLLLDEAFDGVDPLIQEVIKDEIVNSGKDKTFIISSHNITSLERLCDKFIILHKGTLTNYGESQDMGSNFVKYQILFRNAVSKEELEQLGAEIISYKKVGSIVNLVTSNDIGDIIEEKYKPTLMENIPIDPDEIISLEMLIAKKGEEKND